MSESEEQNSYNETEASLHADGLCPICQSPIEADEPSVACPECHTHYHEDCWEANEGCAVYGCKKVPESIKWESHQIPVAYWGQEHKDCPNCGKQIMAAAVRCRHCGEVFETAAPETIQNFKDNKDFKESKVRMERISIILFFLAIIPFIGILVLPISGIRWLTGKKDLIKLKPIFKTYIFGSIILGAVQLLLFIVLGLLHSQT